MKSSINLGSVYSIGNSSGYIMIMKKKKDSVVYSHIFGYEEITYGTLPLYRIQKDYKIFTGSGLSPKVQARFDHEVMRRMKKL